ncbi:MULTISPECIES: endoglucanase [unclassified Methanobrevibacter]|jgi:hypothetical protein|uniref:endoglucanase n=1 Tax=unclassified Methanobrevibacter TaxID=2638681 RepID=UPI0039B93AF0
MNQDKEKLLMILNNLEQDYRSGNISQEKYDYLSEQYNRKLEAINVSERIRTMQGRPNDDSSTNSLQESIDKDNEEDQELIEKFIVKTNKPKKKSKPLGNGAIIAIATLCLIVAFGTGIGFGVFNFDFNGNAVSMFGQASISDSAFPVVVANTTPNTTNITSTSDNYNQSSYISSDTSDSDSSSSSSDTTDSGSTDGSSDSGSSGSGGSDSGGSGSGGSDSGGSGSGGSNSNDGG